MVITLVFSIFLMYENMPLTIIFQIPKLRIIDNFLVPVAKNTHYYSFQTEHLDLLTPDFWVNHVLQEKKQMFKCMHNQFYCIQDGY